MTSSQLTLPAQPSSVSKARKFVRERLLELDAEGACDDAVTLVSELATNAILHARTEFTIVVTNEHGLVRVGVLDLSVVRPRVRDYGTSATTGRGMRLVQAMSAEWGVDVAGSGKTVWFELPAAGVLEDAPAWDEIADVDELLSAFDVEDEHDDVTQVLWRAA